MVTIIFSKSVQNNFNTLEIGGFNVIGKVED